MTFFFLFLETAIIALMAFYIFYEIKLGVPTVPSSSKTVKKMLEMIPSSTDGSIVELGSGWGGVALALARRNPSCQVVGIEYAPLPFFVSRLRAKLNPALTNVRFARKNFFDQPLNGFSVVVCYLLNPVMDRLKGKFVSELPSGALIVSNTFSISGWVPEKIVEVDDMIDKKIFIYRMPQS